MIDAFAGATLDDQFIHTDPERAKAESPSAARLPMASLTLSLLSAMNYSALPKIREQTMASIRFDKVTLRRPGQSAALRVRGRFTRRKPAFAAHRC